MNLPCAISYNSIILLFGVTAQHQEGEFSLRDTLGDYHLMDHLNIVDGHFVTRVAQ